MEIVIAVIALLALDLVFVFHLLRSNRTLPERVASHFTFGGQADGWASRRTYQMMIGMAGPGISVIWPLFAVAMLRTPARSMAPFIVWAGFLMLSFVLSVHVLTVKANQVEPPRLDMRAFWMLLGLLQVGMVVWVVALAFEAK